LLSTSSNHVEEDVLDPEEFEETSRALDELAAAVRELAAELYALAARLEEEPARTEAACHRFLSQLGLPDTACLARYRLAHR
jgi:hypothetical protein